LEQGITEAYRCAHLAISRVNSTLLCRCCNSRNNTLDFFRKRLVSRVAVPQPSILALAPRKKPPSLDGVVSVPEQPHAQRFETHSTAVFGKINSLSSNSVRSAALNVYDSDA